MILSFSSQSELLDGMDRFGASAADLMAPAAKRQYEIKDSVLRNDLQGLCPSPRAERRQGQQGLRAPPGV